MEKFQDVATVRFNVLNQTAVAAAQRNGTKHTNQVEQGKRLAIQMDS